jgi:putative transposase
MDLDSKKDMVNKADEISVVQQCELLELNRSSHYYEPRPEFAEDDFTIMNKMQDIAIENPEYGHRMHWQELLGEGLIIGRDRVLKFMQVLRIKAIYPKPKTTVRDKEHKVYPYLLRDLEINRANQVWATDNTYLPTANGFCYMVAIIDWYSRAILSYRISNSMDKSFCIEALDEALTLYGTPEIFNSDQGCQFTSKDFTQVLESKGIQISMDSKGRALDNIIIERFWRTLKYDDIKIRDYKTINDIKEGVKKYITKYNMKRRHSSLGYVTPFQKYFSEGVLKAA